MVTQFHYLWIISSIKSQLWMQGLTLVLANILVFNTSSVFFKLDMSKYYQTPISEESNSLTVFSTPRVLYVFNHVPSGLFNYATISVRLTWALLHDIKNIATYIDNMFTNTENVNDRTLTMAADVCFLHLRNMSCQYSHLKWDVFLRKHNFAAHYQSWLFCLLRIYYAKF